MTALTALAEPPVCPPAQADRISVVAAVVDAIAAGCVTAGSIADAIDMSGRQGAYYPNAAWRLGYAEPDQSTSPVTWVLTDLGTDLASAGPAERADMLTRTLVGLPDLDTFTGTHGADILTGQWTDAGYSPETVSRRLQTLASWAEFLSADCQVQQNALDVAARVTVERAPQARERAHAHAIATSRPPRRPELLGAVCGRCFVIMPLTGRCQSCD